MQYINISLNALFSALLAPVRATGPWPGIMVIALVASVLVLLIFKITSNQRLVRRRKDRFLARVLELVLFKDDIIVNLGAFGRVLVANMRYLSTLAGPLLVSILPLMLIMIHANVWFGARSLHAGESALVKARFTDKFPVMNQSVSLEASKNIVIETEPVRAPSINEISWRLRVGNGHNGWINININGEHIHKTIALGNALTGVSRRRIQGRFRHALENPLERPLPKTSPLVLLEVHYPASNLMLFGKRLHWLVVFLVLCLVFGWLLKKPLGVVI